MFVKQTLPNLGNTNLAPSTYTQSPFPKAADENGEGSPWRARQVVCLRHDPGVQEVEVEPVPEHVLNPDQGSEQQGGGYVPSSDHVVANTEIEFKTESFQEDSCWHSRWLGTDKGLIPEDGIDGEEDIKEDEDIESQPKVL
ncbi:unnamed protein product [Fraxinus pennsylvanica]|uniref:Uncharacterized protein n=1 Tax=Fraxinus pennsylvanica TaxID=56036 RepID=A0AAD2DUJ3_9LAMI|nr:unnamed protein product [Fraxinus pennsylvanica]